MELHGTDLCIYALKEIVNKYRDNNSSVFMYFIDTSKVLIGLTMLSYFFKCDKEGCQSTL